MEGGVAGNLVPDECVVVVKRRFTPSRTLDEAVDETRALLNGADEVEVTDAATTVVMHDGAMDESRRLVQLTGAFVIAAGLAFGGVRFFGDEPLGRNLEALVGATAFGAVIAAPGVLALLSLWGRPALLLPAAVVLVPFSFLSFALVTLPLLIPAVLLFRAFARATPAGNGWRAATSTLLVLGLLMAALVALFAHEDLRHFTTDAGMTQVTSEVVSYGEAALSFALVLLAGGVGWRSSPTVSREPMPALDSPKR